MRISNVSFALGFDRLELGAPGNLIPTGSRLYAEIGGPLGSWDSLSQATRGTRGGRSGSPFEPGTTRSSFDVAPDSFPVTMPWVSPAPRTRTSTLIDASSNAISTAYNHQRKVVRAGTGGGADCTATTSGGCWYAVFYDQVVESTTAPSTETITTGTSCGGAFPAGIQTSDNLYRCYSEANIPGSGGQAAFQAISAIAASTGVDVTITLPSHDPNDILLLLGWVRDQDDTVSVSGWTAIAGTPFDRGTTSRYWMFWKRAASSSETNPLFDKSTSTGDTYAAVITYRGAITTGNPWEVVGTASTGTSDPASITGINTATDNALVVVPVGGEDNNNAGITTTGTDPSSYTEHYLESSVGTAGKRGAITFSEALRTSAGATGTISVDWDTGVPIGWGGKALSLAPPPNYKLNVKYDFTGVPSGSAYTLRVEGFHTPGEDVLVQVVDSTEATWTTRMTLTQTSDDNADETYTLTTDEYDAGSPNIRFVGATESGDTVQTNLSIDRVSIDTNTWDRIVLMRSLDTSGSTWASQIILASGRSGDGPLVLARDSKEPSIAIDASGYLHVVWVSASAAADQSEMNLVRYTKTTVAYPTQTQLATGGNWQAVTNVDDVNPGSMPTVSTDMSNYPHIAWSQSKVVAVAGAEIAYRSNTGTNTVNSPKTRSWDGSTWGPEAEEATAGSPIRVTRMAWSPTTPNTKIFVTVSDDGFLDAYVCTPTCSVTNNIGQVWTPPNSNIDYRFDIAYEQLSGTALLVYGVLSTDPTRDLAYREYTGSWGPEQYLDNTNNGTDLQYGVMHLAPKIGSDQIGLIAATTNFVITAWIWSGTAFGSFTQLTATGFESYVRDHLAMAWETNSGTLLAVAIPSGGQSVLYSRYTTSWSAPSTFTCSVSGKWIAFIALKPNPISTANNMILAVEDTGSSVSTCYWDGSGWTNFVTHDTASDSWVSRAMDFAWEDTGSKGLLVWGTNANQITYRTYAAPNTWGPITNVSMSSSSFHYWVTLATNPSPQTGGAKILGAALAYIDNDLGAIRWDGSTFTVIGTSTFTADTGSYVYESYDLEYASPNGHVYYKNRAGGTWRSTVTWGATYTGLSVDVSPVNNFVSLARYYEAGTNEIQYTVCNLNATNCDASSLFTKYNGAAGYDSVASAVSPGSYPSLATTWDANADLWVGYTTSAGAAMARFLDYPAAGWQPAETIDALGGTTFARLSLGADRRGDLLAMYEDPTAPQLYYKQRVSGVWDASRTPIDTSSEWPVVQVRAPNDVTYGSLLGGLYWKTSTSETYFFQPGSQIPEFQDALVPILVILLVGLVRRRTRRRPDNHPPYG